MKKIIKASVFVLFAVLIGIVLTGMGQSEEGAADEQITLKVIWWGGQTRHDKTLQVIEMFEEQNPDIKIEPIYLSWDGYWEKLATLVASNEIPDVIQMTIQNMPQYAEKGLLADLRTIDSLDLRDMDKVFMDIGSIDAELLAVTLGANAPCLIYNKAIFDEAGLDYPDDTWTWEDLEKISTAIHDKLGITGINSIIRDYNDFEVYAREMGETIYTKNNQVGFTQGTLKDFMELGQRMIKSGVMEPMEVTMEVRSNEENTPYARGDAAMMFLWSNKIGGVRNTLGQDSELLVYPGPDSYEKGMYIKPGLFFSVARSSKYMEQAGRFIDFFVNNIEANMILNADRGIPVFSKVREALAENTDTQTKKIFAFMDLLGKKSSNPMDTNFPTADREVKLIMRNTMEEVGLGRISPEEGAQKVIEEWEAVLSR
jgi:multiple sugar transport system substrate-binding protein